MERLFFGAEVKAAWPKELPQGRVLDEEERHMTLAFLGSCSLQQLGQLLPEIPLPKFQIGPSGKCDKILFLPKHHPHVVAGYIDWLNQGALFLKFQKELTHWLKSHDYPTEEREFLPHVTIARSPFSAAEWKEIKEEFPLFISAIHLYESVGNLTYVPRWTHAFHAPFEELDHTADIAFEIFGENLHDLHLHAELALSFKYPPLLPYITTEPFLENSLDEIIISLNDLVTRADQEIGTPFKAVSFHGELIKKEGKLFQWEMIVDV
jgi:2'-5' RNA ligase